MSTKPLTEMQINDAVSQAIEKAGLSPHEVLSVEFSAGSGVVRAQVIDHSSDKPGRQTKWIEVGK